MCSFACDITRQHVYKHVPNLFFSGKCNEYLSMYRNEVNKVAFKSSGDEDLNLSEESEKDYDERGSQNSDISVELNSGLSSVGATEIYNDSFDSDFGFIDTVETSGSENEVSDFDKEQSFREKKSLVNNKQFD